MTPATRIDLYQLTSLVAHHAQHHTDDRVVMSFFSRRLPRNHHTGETARDYLLFAGLQRCLDHLEQARFDADALDSLKAHPALGPALAQHPDLVDRLADWRFRGSVRAPLEGTPLLAGPALRLDGTPIDVNGVRPAAYCPYLEIETDLLSAKLIETPLLSVINHMTMVATKAVRVVQAAEVRGASVLEFGTRRTHPAAAVDAAIAAYIAGCSATSNVEAHVRHGVPVAGTMDHFAIQAWEQPGVPRHETEAAFFRTFAGLYPASDILLVDTYDTFGTHTGIRAAVAASAGLGPAGIRIDSAITAENIRRARSLLDSLGATHTRIYVSGGMDEDAIAALGDAPVDGFGVGERIVTSPDAPVGVGAVAKLSEVRGTPTMKLSRGSGKATLPGRLQVWRTDTEDRVALAQEEHPGQPLLRPVWTSEAGRLEGPTLAQVRDHAARSVAGFGARRLVVSDPVATLIATLVDQGVR